MVVELHASFDPHASVLFHPLMAGVGGWGLGAGCERLKTEEVGAIGGEAMVCFGAAGGFDGVEKSKRSSKPELATFELGAWLIPGAESNAPNPLDELNPLEGCGGGAGF